MWWGIKIRLNTSGCLWLNLFAEILQGFAYRVKINHLRGRQLEFNNFQASDIMECYTSVLVYQETDFQTGECPNEFYPKDWVNWEKSVSTHLYMVLNTRDIYLIYVIHKGNHQEDNMITIYEKIVWNDPLKESAFNVYGKTLLILLKGACNGTNGDTWIKGIQCGKGATQAL